MHVDGSRGSDPDPCPTAKALLQPLPLVAALPCSLARGTPPPPFPKGAADECDSGIAPGLRFCCCCCCCDAPASMTLTMAPRTMLCEGRGGREAHETRLRFHVAGRLGQHVHARASGVSNSTAPLVGIPKLHHNVVRLAACWRGYRARPGFGAGRRLEITRNSGQRVTAVAA